MKFQQSKEFFKIPVEAVKNISLDVKEDHPDIEWRKIGGMRDKIIHIYFGVN
ncbi:MAG: DUF86 domain-containing protein [Candidatus Saliniplasma sp.]